MTNRQAIDIIKGFGQEQMQRSGPQMSEATEQQEQTLQRHAEQQGWVSHPVGPVLSTSQGQWHPSWLHLQNLSIITAGLVMHAPGTELTDEQIATRATRIYKLIMFHARDL